MNLKWTSKSLSDLARLHDFLVTIDSFAALHTVQMLVATPKKLLANPRIGEIIEDFAPRKVRRILVGHYEMRYEIQQSTIYVLRIWHTREER